ncbi:hypothetical protein PUN28_008481 [Cardiocondyla obscurior]|uniref:Uncharacterized protein n=1 Tax=Cardiocondyla obscurior TaxID=286306 RepID=A0AAW2FZK6_9HYME
MTHCKYESIHRSAFIKPGARLLYTPPHINHAYAFAKILNAKSQKAIAIVRLPRYFHQRARGRASLIHSCARNPDKCVRPPRLSFSIYYPITIHISATGHETRSVSPIAVSPSSLGNYARVLSARLIFRSRGDRKHFPPSLLIKLRSKYFSNFNYNSILNNNNK